LLSGRLYHILWAATVNTQDAVTVLVVCMLSQQSSLAAV